MNNLPLTSFLIEYKPCILPYETFTKQADDHYLLENDQFYPKECSESVIDKFKWDVDDNDRYVKILSTNEHLIQLESGV